MPNITNIELYREIEELKKRNARVDADKSWETSIVRKLILAIITYIFFAVLMFLIKIEEPLVNAFIPTLAYLVGNLSLGILKSWWLNKKHD